MKLTIVVPALNEEKAIGSTIERCLAAREDIVRDSPVDEVEIIIVSDGSTDRTAEVAAAFDEVRVIVFERNRGYGAAIKRGFEEGSGELVGFLDADGTCEPAFFATLCRALIEEEAAVALGSRMGPESRMPMVRRIGNRIYAFILSALSNRVVTDTASGMRVIRRDALPHLYPLPDGLHFTPAMSARVLMDDRLAVAERPMPYEERIGESKLHVIKDGARFLRTILEMTLMWQPAKLFVVAAVACFALMMLFGVHPMETWLRARRLEEDMIYRLLFCSLLGTLGVTLLSAGIVSYHLHRLLSALAPPSLGDPTSAAYRASSEHRASWGHTKNVGPLASQPAGGKPACWWQANLPVQSVSGFRRAGGKADVPWNHPARPPTFLWTILDKAYTLRGSCLALALTVPMLVWLVGRGVWTWASAGYVDVHWSRVVLGGLLAFGAAQVLVTVLITNVIRFHTARASLSGSSPVGAPVSADAETLHEFTSSRAVEVRQDEPLPALRLL
jgi:glycosyltransferase involved in cell wall biosynthesis